MAQPVEQLITDIPPITRAWVIASVGTTLLVQCNVVAPIQLYFSWKAAVFKLQIWRFITTFCYFGPLSLGLAFHLFFVMRYPKILEESSFSNRRADFAFLLIFLCTFLLLTTPFLTIPFLSSPLSTAIVYIWSRRNPSVRMSLMGIVEISASYMPHFLVALNVLIKGNFEEASGDIFPPDSKLGIVAGHTYVFLQDYWPREMWSTTGRPQLQTPEPIKRLFGQEDAQRTP